MIIQIHDWKLRAIVGVYPHERNRKQTLVLNLDIDYDAEKALQSDDIKDALDYEELRIRIEKLVSDNEYFLLEKMVSRISKEVLRDKRVNRVQITLSKPEALKNIAHVSLVFEQKR